MGPERVAVSIKCVYCL